MTRPGLLPMRRVVVRGPSMAPTLRDGDIVLACFWVRPRPGGIALVRWASRPGQLSVKRVVRRQDTGWWVLGDNEFGSTDSRALGAAAVLATIRVRLWPRPKLLRRERTRA